MSRQALAARPPGRHLRTIPVGVHRSSCRSRSPPTSVGPGAGTRRPTGRAGVPRVWVLDPTTPEVRAEGVRTAFSPRGCRGEGLTGPEAVAEGRRPPTWPPRTSAANWCPRASNPAPAARRPIRTGRSIALPVLAELLGLGTTTATRWAAVAGREPKPVHGHAPSGSDASTKAAGVLTGAGQPARAPAGPANQLPADDARSHGIARRHRPANGLRVVGSQFAGGGQFFADGEQLAVGVL
jgi:hypothetical protein